MFKPGAGRRRPRPLHAAGSRVPESATASKSSLSSVTPGSSAARNKPSPLAPSSGRPQVQPLAVTPESNSARNRPSFVAPTSGKPQVQGLARGRAPGKAVRAKAALSSSPIASTGDSSSTLYFAVLYTKRSRKKTKSYSDGFVSLLNDRALTLLSESGKVVSKSSSSAPLGGLKEGNTLEIGTFEIEVDRELPSADFTSGRAFLPPTAKVSSAVRPGASPSVAGGRSSKGTLSSFKAPRGKDGVSHVGTARPLKPLHDPNAANSVIIFPSLSNERGRSSVPIVLDPHLARHMRPHQVEGVRFLYRCVEGGGKTRDLNSGAILADEMGLGKSLQAIALLWTLLKQGPYGNPVAHKAIIVCPASLVSNWVAEIKKWLGDERLCPISIHAGTSKSYNGLLSIQDFIRGKVKRALVISYEMFRSFADDLRECACGLVICDEGHRLKSAQGNKTISSLMSIPCRRRIILTGTPVQNDLEEFFAMCNFVNPGALGDLATFRSVFANPIVASRDAVASSESLRIGSSRAHELQRLSGEFVLRRTSSTLAKYLPPKTETVVFCRMTPSQSQAYRDECKRGFVNLGLASNMGVAFTTITRLRKICSHPKLPEGGSKSSSCAESMSPESLSAIDPVESTNEDTLVSACSKLQVAMSITLESVNIGDRVVLVSNFTSCLDVLEKEINGAGLKFFRLDGSTATKLRGDLVSRFNSGRTGESVFLLSAKAGGVGLNLIGANRLICYDPDWNPATDLQAMARVWRDGQSKHVHIYRLMSTGTIEEKMYQRQLFKGELQLTVRGVADGATARSPPDDAEGASYAGASRGLPSLRSSNFSAEELRDLFTYNEAVEFCDTLDVLDRSMEDARGQDDPVDGSSEPAGVPKSLQERFTRFKSSLEDMKQGIPLDRCRFRGIFQRDSLLKGLMDGACSSLISYIFSEETNLSLAGSSSEAEEDTQGDDNAGHGGPHLAASTGRDVLCESLAADHGSDPERILCDPSFANDVGESIKLKRRRLCMRATDAMSFDNVGIDVSEADAGASVGNRAVSCASDGSRSSCQAEETSKDLVSPQSDMMTMWNQAVDVLDAPDIHLASTGDID